MGFLMGTLAKYRFLTGDKQFDDLLTGKASPYARFRLRGDLAGLTAGLKTCVEALRVNWEGYTSEVRWTDRVLRFPGGYLAHTQHPLPSPNPRLLYSSATGDPGDIGYFPMNAVRWLTPPRGIAALVVDNSPRHLTAKLFHFGDKPRHMAAELYLLEVGQYRFELSDEPRQRVVASSAFRVLGPRTPMKLSLPPTSLCTLRITKTNPPAGSKPAGG
jgi:hypothetical protein